MQAVAKGWYGTNQRIMNCLPLGLKSKKKQTRQHSSRMRTARLPTVWGAGLQVWYETDERRNEPLYPRTKSLNISLDSKSFTKWFVWGARDRDLKKIAKFLHPHWEYIKFNFFNQLVGFECIHHLWLSTPLKLHSFSSKVMIHRSPPPPKILGQKAKSNR